MVIQLASLGLSSSDRSIELWRPRLAADAATRALAGLSGSRQHKRRAQPASRESRLTCLRSGRAMRKAGGCSRQQQVLMLDHAPPELVRLVGYRESIARVPPMSFAARVGHKGREHSSTERMDDGQVRAAGRGEDLVRRARLRSAPGAVAWWAGRRAVVRAQPRTVGGAVPRLHTRTSWPRTHPRCARPDHLPADGRRHHRLPRHGRR